MDMSSEFILRFVVKKASVRVSKALQSSHQSGTLIAIVVTTKGLKRNGFFVILRWLSVFIDSNIIRYGRPCAHSRLPDQHTTSSHVYRRRIIV